MFILPHEGNERKEEITVSEALNEIMIPSQDHFGQLVFRPITNDQEADMYLQEIKKAEEKKKEWKAFYKERSEAMVAEFDNSIANMKAVLHSYFDKVPHKQTATQENYALPSGKLVFKKQNNDFEYDETELIKWLEANEGEQFVKVKKEVNWSGLKETLLVAGETVADENGTIIPAIKAIEREPVFTVELKRK